MSDTVVVAYDLSTNSLRALTVDGALAEYAVVILRDVKEQIQRETWGQETAVKNGMEKVVQVIDEKIRELTKDE